MKHADDILIFYECAKIYNYRIEPSSDNLSNNKGLTPMYVMENKISYVEFHNN